MRVQRSILCILLCIVMGLGNVLPARAAEMTGDTMTASTATKCPNCGKLSVYEYPTEAGATTRYEKCTDRAHVDGCYIEIVYVTIFNVSQCAASGCDYIDSVVSGIRELSRRHYSYA